MPEKYKKKRERTPEERKEHKKIALYLAGWFVLVASVYFAVVQFMLINETDFIMYAVMQVVYMVLGIVFFFLWMLFNGGVKKFDETKFEKPEEMGYDEFCRFIDMLKARQKKSKYFMVLFMPFFIVVLIDFLIIIWGG